MLKALHTEEKGIKIMKHKQKHPRVGDGGILTIPSPRGGFRTVLNCDTIVPSVNTHIPNGKHHTVWGSSVVFFVVKKGELQ